MTSRRRPKCMILVHSPAGTHRRPRNGTWHALSMGPTRESRQAPFGLDRNLPIGLKALSASKALTSATGGARRKKDSYGSLRMEDFERGAIDIRAKLRYYFMEIHGRCIRGRAHTEAVTVSVTSPAVRFKKLCLTKLKPFPCCRYQIYPHQPDIYLLTSPRHPKPYSVVPQEQRVDVHFVSDPFLCYLSHDHSDRMIFSAS